MAKTLKKAKKPPKIGGRNKPYAVRWGTPNVLGEPRRFATLPEAKKAVAAEVKGLEAWCARHNSAGLPALEVLKVEFNDAPFARERRRIQCVFDERYATTFCVEYWLEGPL